MIVQLIENRNKYRIGQLNIDKYRCNIDKYRIGYLNRYKYMLDS